VRNTEELLSHFSCAEAGLKPGGLYFLDWCVDFEPLANNLDSWVMRRQGITVNTRYSTRLHNAPEQLYEESILFTIKEKGQERTLPPPGVAEGHFPRSSSWRNETAQV